MSYLLLDTFEHGRGKKLIEERGEHAFLEYSAKSWAIHFRNAVIQKGSQLLPLARDICKPGSRRLRVWLKACGQMESSNELMVASYFGLDAIVELLLEEQDLDIDQVDPGLGRTALSMAAGGGSERVVKMLLLAGTKSLNWTGPRGRTPLLWAAENGNAGVIRLLLDQPGIELDQPCSMGRTPLSYAAENGQEDVVGLLLNRGALTETFNINHILTPLAYAAQNGHAAVVEQLLQTRKVNVQFRDWKGNTLLLMAARNGHDAVVRLLLRVPDIDPNCRNTEGRSALSVASELGHFQVVRLLTETKGVDLDAKDEFYGRTPMLWATRTPGNEDLVKYLIDAGAKDIECEGRWPNRTALSYACEEGNETAVRLLLKTGLANPNSMSTYGRTPLSFASEKGHASIVKQLLALESVKPDLADTTYGRTPLSWAAARGHVEVVQLLLDTNAVDIWSRDLMYNRTPGVWAARNGYRELAGLLQYTDPEEPEEPEPSKEPKQDPVGAGKTPPACPTLQMPPGSSAGHDTSNESSGKDLQV